MFLNKKSYPCTIFPILICAQYGILYTDTREKTHLNYAIFLPQTFERNLDQSEWKQFTFFPLN